MSTPNVHPEGLPFEPTGPGWTEPSALKNGGPFRYFLLSDHNVEAIRNNERAAFDEALESLKMVIPVQRLDPRTGLKTMNGMSEEQIQRLAALSILVTKGVVQ